MTPAGGNYLAKLEALFAAGEFTPGQLSESLIQDDDWCAALVHGEQCDCDPVIHYRPVHLDPAKRKEKPC